MPVANYGTTSPAGLDPYPIESVLAQHAYSGYANSPAEAQTALDQYQLQNWADKQNYEADLQAQHDFAYQQLGQQLTEARWKAQAEAKDPTVLQIMANDPNSPLSGINTGVLGDLIARGRQTQDITNLEHAGTGYNQFSQGGGDPTALMRAQGIDVGPNQGPALVQAARIRAAAQLAAAKLGQSAGPSISLVGNPEADLGGASIHANWSAKSGQTPEGARAYARSQGLVPSGTIAPPPGTSLAPAGQNNQPSQQQTSPGTSSGGSTAKAAPQSVGGNAQVYKNVRDTIETLHSSGKISAADYANLKNFTISPQGKITGANGKTYN